MISKPENKSSLGLQAGKKWLCLLAVLLSAALLAGCASVKYTYGTQTFSTSGEALAAQRANLDGILAAIQPTSTPVHGKALVALPSRTEVRKHYVHITGNASLLGQEQLDYVCATLEADHEMLANAMQKRGVFDQLTTTQAEDPAAVSIGGNEFLIYCDIDGWFIKTPKSSPYKVVMDASAAPGLPRTRAFLDTLEQTARGLAK